MIHLYDAAHVIRMKLNNDPMGRGPRNIIMEMMNANPRDIHIWVYEGMHSLRERREIYPDYKVKPEQPGITGFFAMQDLIKDALKHTPAFQIDVPRREADDVIAALCLKYFKISPILIHTMDRDLNQLCALPNVTTIAKTIDGVKNEHIRLFKTYVGDPSDKIPGVTGFGIKTWNKCDPNMLLDAHHLLVDNDPDLDPLEFQMAGVPGNLTTKIIENRELITAYWKIIGFLSIDDVLEHLRSGHPDLEKADAILKEFLH